MLTKAPEQYAAVLGMTQRAVKTAGKELTVNELIESMSDQFRISEGATEGNKKENESEIQLGAVFKGKCYKCGKTGHRKSECPNNRSDGNNESGGGKRKFTGRCRHCNKVGHKEKDCWSKPGNEHKRPARFGGAGENGASNVNSANNAGGASYNVEVLMAGVEFSLEQSLICREVSGENSIDEPAKNEAKDGERINLGVAVTRSKCIGEVGMGKVEPALTFAQGVEILKDPNIWIADTGASTHSTPHDYGLINRRNAHESESVTMGVGAAVKPKQVGDIIGTQYDKYGNQSLKGKMTEVSVIPGGNYNMYSLTRMMEQSKH